MTESLETMLKQLDKHLPTCAHYSELLEQAIWKGHAESREEARDKYGSFTYEQWAILLAMVMFIGRTKEYYEDDDNWVFVPPLWTSDLAPTEFAGEVYVLTDEGEDLLGRWTDDMAVGYDLCNGRAKGLAAEYSREQMWNLLTDEKNGYARKYEAHD